jgi:hypothetical protein
VAVRQARVSAPAGVCDAGNQAAALTLSGAGRAWVRVADQPGLAASAIAPAHLPTAGRMAVRSTARTKLVGRSASTFQVNQIVISLLKYFFELSMF